MKMDGRDRAEYQNWEKDINVILEKFKLVKDKTCIVCLLHLTKEENKCGKPKRGEPVDRNLSFSERESSFSLEIRAIRLSVVFGTRRRTALCGEGFTWVLDLGSFLKLREVGVSPYLGFIPSLSTL